MADIVIRVVGEIDEDLADEIRELTTKLPQAVYIPGKPGEGHKEEFLPQRSPRTQRIWRIFYH